MEPSVLASASSAKMMRHENKQWVVPFDQQTAVQVIQQQNQFFLLIVGISPNHKPQTLMEQDILTITKYDADINKNFLVFRNEQRTVYGLQFGDRGEAQLIDSVIEKIRDLVKPKQRPVYQEPQTGFYAQGQNGSDSGFRNEGDGDSLGSNGVRHYNNYQQQPQQISQHLTLQQQRRASQTSSGSSSTLQQNIYATAQLNGFNNSPQQPSQMTIGQLQTPPNGHHPFNSSNGSMNHVQNGMNGHTNGHSNGHQQQLRQAVAPPQPPPAPAMPQGMMNNLMNNGLPQNGINNGHNTSNGQNLNHLNPAPVSTSAPPPPPPPPPPAQAKVQVSSSAPPPPPPPPPGLLKGAATPATKPKTMADAIKAASEAKAANNANGVQMKAPEKAPVPAQCGTGALMDELQQKIRRMQNNAEVGSVGSTASTSSTLSSASSESRENPPKPWQKTSNASLNSNSTQNGGTLTLHPTNNGTDSPIIRRKTTVTNGSSEERYLTLADLERFKQDILTEFQQIVDKRTNDMIEMIRQELQKR
ncbi:unnamed protein product [Bursaphelenchus okinawaensis]|uniref:WH1 domain-containing protein n=1 Tax=Bursaphelenchus okinawaensis TaxID=465554 RepID=A0A811LB52_9BILA|nr:unnamed protein product [Bursaphelenchus okinawaensis]CAG9119845.1 unnamed protein product [Bursaphelenchus okinawaensis]